MGTSQTNHAQQVVIEPTAAQAATFMADLIKTIVCDVVARREHCHMALAGGTTPHLLYQALTNSAATGEVPWGGVTIYFGDERDVPLDHVESNYYMAQRTLLDHVPIEPDRIHPMRGDADDLDAAAAEYEQIIRRQVPAGPDGVSKFDLILLGVGADGHTASLFPDTAALDEQKKLVACNRVPVLGRDRLTFTFPLINAARHVILMVTGEDKAPAVKKLLDADPKVRREIPAGRIEPAGGALTLVMDAVAAQLLDHKQ